MALSPVALLESKCYVIVRQCKENSHLKLDSVVYRPACWELRAFPACILQVKRILDTFIIETDCGVFDMSSYLVHDTMELAERVCKLYNESKGGVSHEQEETSDQG